MPRRSFGSVRESSPKKFQARYTVSGVRYNMPGTYSSKKEALAALAIMQADITEQGAAWVPPGFDPEADEQARIRRHFKEMGWEHGKGGAPSFGKFAAQVMELRRGELAPRTWEGYDSLLKRWLLPTFGPFPLNTITVQRVDAWWSDMGKKTGKVNRRNAYFLLSGIMKRAVRYKHIQASPCIIEGAGKKVSQPRPFLPLADFRRIVAEAPASLSAPLWTMFSGHLRVGETVGLNRGDVDLSTGLITVDKQAQQVRGGLTIRETKTNNQKTIKLLDPALDVLAAHLEGNTDPDDAPLFRGPKGGRLSRGYFYAQWVKARDRAGLPEAHLHDTKHTGLTLVAPHASTRELMNRGGHATAAAALIYQHATADRDAEVADAASAALKG